MTKLLLILVLTVPLVTAACDRGPGDDRAAGRGPYVSGGFGGH